MQAEDFDTIKAISPYADFPFIFQDMHCASLAAFCLALTNPFLGRQADIAKMKQNDLVNCFTDIDLSDQHDLYWQGRTYQKDGHDLDTLMETVFYALGENEDFKEWLFQSGDACVTHKYQDTDPLRHILPADIYAHHMMMLRYHFGFDR